MAAPNSLHLALRPAPLTQQAAAIIKDRILTGELSPGERLVEQQLAKALGVGQNVIREALIDLAHRGFVRRETNRGTYVMSLTQAEAIKLGQVRAVLEVLAVEMAARRAAHEPLDFSELDRRLAQMKAAALAQNREEYYHHDLKFHEALWNLADNPFLSQALEQIVAPLFAFFIMLYMRRTDSVDSALEAVATHERVVQHLKDADTAGSVEAMRDLLAFALRSQQELIPQE